MKALEGLRAAGATVVFDDSILPDSFAETASRVCTLPYVREGTEKFLAGYGPAQYHSPRSMNGPLDLLAGDDHRRRGLRRAQRAACGDTGND